VKKVKHLGKPKPLEERADLFLPDRKKPFTENTDKQLSSVKNYPRAFEHGLHW
jgi:hypothetical protein